MRIIGASWSKCDDGPYIELFGKTSGRQSITIAVFGFETYLYAVDPTESLEKAAAADTGVSSVSHVPLFYKGDVHDTLKISVREPWYIPTLRKKLGSRTAILAGDIQYPDRYIYDSDMGSCIRVTGEETDLGYHTDLTVKMSSFENIEPFDPGLKYLSFDIENSITDQHIYCICTVTEEAGVMKSQEPIFGDEADIIQRFSELIREEDPDVITGYNIDNYDIRKIRERAAFLKMKDPLQWGRDGGEPKLFSERFWRVKGRLITDAWWAAKRELRPKQETLNAVSMQVLGEQKLDVDPKHMDSEWENNREKVLEYCTQDARLALKILQSVGTVRKGMDLAAVSKLPVEDVLVSGTSTLVDSLLIRLADRSGVGVPMNGRRD